jgi:molybdenum cofactor biosynthesis enzyme MoaA
MSGTPISHGQGQMRAQSISIQVSNREKCNGGCLYCISQTTPGDDQSKLLGSDVTVCPDIQLKTALNYAKCLGATHAILTGKADPLQEHPDTLYKLITESRQHLPLVDMHTNGLLLHENFKKGNLLENLFKAGLTMITFSIASFDQEKNRELMRIKKSAADLIDMAVTIGLMVRCSLVVNKQGAHDAAGVMDYIRQAGELGAHQVVVREVWVPEIYGQRNLEVYNWNLANKVDIKPIQNQFHEYSRYAPYKDLGLSQLDPLPWGTPVFALGGVFKNQDHGVNVTFACCEEGSSGPVMKSIVLKPNGRVYRGWAHPGDVLC